MAATSFSADGVSAAFPAVATSGVVALVVDGDTLVVRLAGGKRERVRVLGIDSPEMQPRERCAVQAAQAARRLALGKSVALIGDRTQATRDRYKRLLAYVTLPGGSDLGSRLVATGYAKVYVFGGRPFLRVATYRAAENNARAKRFGLWGNCSARTVVPAPKPVPPAPPTTTAVVPLVPTVPTTTGTTTTGTTPTTTTTTTGTTTTTPPPPPPTSYACSNGVDDDGDGKIDYPADPGCTGSSDTDETDATSTCHASYPDFCIPPPPPDKDCGDFTQKNFRVDHTVANPDPHGLDGDKDGKACES